MIKPLVKVTHKTHGGGLPLLNARLSGVKGLTVRVGLPDNGKEADGTPLPMIGFVHEFGSPEQGIPERSFMRSSVRENDAKYRRFMKNAMGQIVAGKTTPTAALGKLGAVAVGDVQRMIAKGDFVPLSPKTIKRKGSSKPLIDTGQMRQNITWVLSSGKGA